MSNFIASRVSHTDSHNRLLTRDVELLMRIEWRQIAYMCLTYSRVCVCVCFAWALVANGTKETTHTHKHFERRQGTWHLRASLRHTKETAITRYSYDNVPWRSTFTKHSSVADLYCQHRSPSLVDVVHCSDPHPIAIAVLHNNTARSVRIPEHRYDVDIRCAADTLSYGLSSWTHSQRHTLMWSVG